MGETRKNGRQLIKTTVRQPWYYRLAAHLMTIGALSVFASSCVRHSEMQDEGVDYFQGVWEQDSLPQQSALLEYTLHSFKITCDSMYTSMRVHQKVQRTTDSCYNGGTWTEYAKGVYVLRGDSILVEGVYTREDGKQKVSGCYRQGTYLPRFKITKTSDTTITLQSRYDQRPIHLSKKKDINCVPKPRWE